MVMTHLSLDLETKSSVDIMKSGVYRYAEAEDFAILLFGYAVDSGATLTLSVYACRGTCRISANASIHPMKITRFPETVFAF